MKLSAKQGFELLIILILSISINIFVYMMGGTNGPWDELNFIIIILAAYFWQKAGSVLVAIIQGLILGPFMPLNVSRGIMQTPENWLFRITIYLVVAFVAAHIFYKNNKIEEKLREKEFIGSMTGLYNTKKLFYDMEHLTKKRKKDSLAVAVIKVMNLKELSDFYDFNLLQAIVKTGIKNIKNLFPDGELYEVDVDDYVLIVNDYDEKGFIQNLSTYIEQVQNSIILKNHPLKLVIKAGIAFCDKDHNCFKKQFSKARIAAVEGGINESGVYTYSIDFEQQRKLSYEIAGSLQTAIENNELYLVYQPIINLKNNSISGVEVLIRWNRGTRQPVGPGVFIKIAEETGMIEAISKWIFEEAIQQIVNWKRNGMDVKASLNFSSGEILNNSFINWNGELIDETSLDPSNLSIELTERVASDKKINSVLSALRKRGYKISIDDFGTGYNSLMTICELPYDNIKIDKYFIDHLDRPEITATIENVIKHFQNINKKVVAEGVETKEQFEVLKEFGCDMIQGYYFSKPLLPNELKQYYATFNMDQYI